MGVRRRNMEVEKSSLNQIPIVHLCSAALIFNEIKCVYELIQNNYKQRQHQEVTSIVTKDAGSSTYSQRAIESLYVSLLQFIDFEYCYVKRVITHAATKVKWVNLQAFRIQWSLIYLYYSEGISKCFFYIF